MNDLAGKRVLITGATGGIGRETALALARRGAEVVAVGRSAEKLDALRRELGDAAPAPIVGDLSVLSALRTVAEAFLTRYDRLDVLVNNAGAVNMSRHVTADGFELTFATNHLGYFLLTALLVPTLKATAKASGEARVVSVASGAHRAGNIDWNDLNAEKSYSGFRQYGTTKLMNILFASELARRLAGTGVTSNSLHPGVVATGFARNDPGPIAWLAKTFGPLFLKSPEQGAATTIFLAGSPTVRGVTGLYYSDCKPKEPLPKARDRAAAERLWDVSAKLVGVSPSLD